jgi:hypothetical protein
MARKNFTITPELEAALATLTARKNREAHPDGSFDKQGRWYPSDSEKQACCSSIRTPSRSFPYSYMVHCRTTQHVAALHGVSASELASLARKDATPKREGGDCYYKAVALKDGKFYSIYDGETEYEIGVELAERARQGHKGGYYVYRSVEAARAVEVPSTSVLRSYPRAILRIQCLGAYCTYDNGKLSFHRVTPVEVIEIPQQQAA